MLLFRRHNQNQTFYFGLDTILLNERSYGNILIYDISRKTLIDTKPLRITFSIVDGFIKVYDATRYLVSRENKNFISFTKRLDVLYE